MPIARIGGFARSMPVAAPLRWGGRSRRWLDRYTHIRPKFVKIDMGRECAGAASDASECLSSDRHGVCRHRRSAETIRQSFPVSAARHRQSPMGISRIRSLISYEIYFTSMFTSGAQNRPGFGSRRGERLVGRVYDELTGGSDDGSLRGVEDGWIETGHLISRDRIIGEIDPA